MTRARTDNIPHVHTRARTHTRTHAHTWTHTKAGETHSKYTHTHTHTHTYSNAGSQHARKHARSHAARTHTPFLTNDNLSRYKPDMHTNPIYELTCCVRAVEGKAGPELIRSPNNKKGTEHGTYVHIDGI